MNVESQLINIDSTKTQTKHIFEFLPSAQYNDTLEKRSKSYGLEEIDIITVCTHDMVIIGGKMKSRF